MPTTQVQLVQRTFEQLRPQHEAVALMLYDRLFTMDPTASRLFHSDAQKQRLLVVSALSLLITHLDCPAILTPFVQGLGIRHAAYGVTRAQYTSLGEVLLWTLEQHLGADFTPEVQAAWQAVYGSLAQMMQDAATATTDTSP